MLYLRTASNEIPPEATEALWRGEPLEIRDERGTVVMLAVHPTRWKLEHLVALERSARGAWPTKRKRETRRERKARAAARRRARPTGRERRR